MEIGSTSLWMCMYHEHQLTTTECTPPRLSINVKYGILGDCFNVALSISTNVPLWWGILTTGTIAHVLGRQLGGPGVRACVRT